MEFWEGAILVVGGIWLVGRVSRNSPHHPVTASAIALNLPQSAGNTIGTQQDGSGALVWGESLAPPVAPLPAHVNIATVSPVGQHVAAAPIATYKLMPPNPGPRFDPLPMTPKPQTAPAISPYANRVPVRSNFLDL
jgi:hypothetical protein